MGRLIHEETGEAVSEVLEVADTFWSRARGLLGRAELATGSGLLIAPCSSIHTFFMRFAIDLIYVARAGDGRWRIRKVVQQVRPWRLSACPGAHAVIELGAGTLAGFALEPGHHVVQEE